jgi:hypothetical protein
MKNIAFLQNFGGPFDLKMECIKVTAPTWVAVGYAVTTSRLTYETHKSRRNLKSMLVFKYDVSELSIYLM